MAQEAPKDRQASEVGKARKKDFHGFLRDKMTPGTPKRKTSKEYLEAHYEKDVDEITARTEQKLDKLKDDVAAKMAVYDEMNAQLQALNDVYKSSVNQAGGQNKTIDTDLEYAEFNKYYLPALKGIEIDSLAGGISGWGKTDQGKTFSILTKLAQGQELAAEDYSMLADELVENNNSGMTYSTDKEGKVEALIMSASQVSTLGVIMSLEGKQKMELADVLVSKGENGIRAIDKLGMSAYYTGTQLEKLYQDAAKAGVSEEFLATYMAKIEDGTYAKAAEEVREYMEKSAEALNKFPHENLGNAMLSYRNVLLYEIVFRGAIAVVAINLFMHAKNRDPLGALTNVPLLASAGIAAGTYDMVTEGHLSGAASNAANKKERKSEKAELERQKFMDDYFGKPDMAKWFRDNIEPVREAYLLKTNNEKEKTTITFEDVLGVEMPEERDGMQKAEAEELISGWFYTLNWEVSGQDTAKDALDKMWEEQDI